MEKFLARGIIFKTKDEGVLQASSPSVFFMFSESELEVVFNLKSLYLIRAP